MDLIDKVARALYDRESFRNREAIGGDILLPFEECKPKFTADAIAAIQALEPTDDMAEACMITGGEPWQGPSKTMLKAYFSAMVRAALDR